MSTDGQEPNNPETNPNEPVPESVETAPAGNGETDATESDGIIRSIKAELFSNPFKSLWDYFKRMWAYFKLTLVQFRNPTFIIDQDPDFVIQKQGIFFPVFFRFLNPLGTTGQEKIDRLDRGDDWILP